MSWFAPFEWRDLRELEGRKVLHLQCHLGTETMAFALKGARTTGLDFSHMSLHEARRVARETGLSIEYVHADVYDAVKALGAERFDIVYTGKGALCYLPDLTPWAQKVALLLKPGGFLYLVEFHPLLNALGPTQSPGFSDDLVLRHDYLGGRGAIERDTSHSYTDGPALVNDTLHYEGLHGLGEVTTAIAQAGFTIRSLAETCLLPWRRWPSMVRSDVGWWAMPGERTPVPSPIRAQGNEAVKAAGRTRTQQINRNSTPNRRRGTVIGPDCAWRLCAKSVSSNIHSRHPSRVLRAVAVRSVFGGPNVGVVTD